jgi:hypothetical protein
MSKFKTKKIVLEIHKFGFGICFRISIFEFRIF